MQERVPMAGAASSGELAAIELTRAAGRRSRKFLFLLGVGGLAVAHLMAAGAFRRRTDAIFGRLEKTAAAGSPPPPIPAILQSYLHRALGGQAAPRLVWLRQTGEMRASPDARWRPFSAEQAISVDRPGFVWLARMQVMPLLPAHVLDCYVDGEGLLEVRLCGSVPLARAAGLEVSKGELMRYLAELMWAPHAMRHNSALSWREIDTRTVEVSARTADGPARVRLVFENGDIARMEADDRPRAAGRRIMPTRWRACCGDYREFEGCRIPTRAAVSWLLEDGPFEYWRGTVTAFSCCSIGPPPEHSHSTSEHTQTLVMNWHVHYQSADRKFIAPAIDRNTAMAIASILIRDGRHVLRIESTTGEMIERDEIHRLCKR